MEFCERTRSVSQKVSTLDLRVLHEAGSTLQSSATTTKEIAIGNIPPIRIGIKDEKMDSHPLLVFMFWETEYRRRATSGFLSFPN